MSDLERLVDGFSAFTPEQQVQLQARRSQQRGEYQRLERRVFHRLLAVLCIVLFAIAVGAAAGLYQIGQDRHAAQCDLARVITIAIPQSSVPGRTAAQQANVDKFYRALAKQGIYTQTTGC